MDSISARAFGINHEVELRGQTREFGELFYPARIEAAAVQKEADVPAEGPFDPGRVPHVFVTENFDRVTARTPAERAQQNGIEQADVIAGKKVAFGWIEPLEPVSFAQIRETKKGIAAEAKQGLSS